MNEQFLAALQAENLPVSLDESLGRHTTFRIGGNADFFCVPATVTQLTRILELCRQYQVRTYLLGNGSNTLFSDAGFGGAVICLTGLNSRFSMQAQPDGSTKVLAPAGMMLSALCNTAQKESLAGLEFAFGIPGTVGGALAMNAGCYGGETKDILVRAWGYDRQGRRVDYDLADFGYTYRHSQAPADIIWVEATYRGRPDDPDAVAARIAEITARRETTQPIREKTGGSTFKNPEGHSSWKLVDEAGWRGKLHGGAMFSPLHSNFMINTGQATAADLEGLGEAVRADVKAKTGIELQWEIKRIGRPGA